MQARSAIQFILRGVLFNAIQFPQREDVFGLVMFIPYSLCTGASLLWSILKLTKVPIELPSGVPFTAWIGSGSAAGLKEQASSFR